MNSQTIQYKDNANVGPANDVSSIGAGGLFSQVGQNPVISSVTGLKRGFESMLPVRGSLIDNPQVKIITGIDEATAASGDDCGKYPTAGQFKVCHINDYPFAKYGMKSRTVDLTEIGLVNSNWTNQMQDVIGDPFMNDARTDGYPNSLKPSYRDIARRTISKILNEMSFSASVEYGRQCLYGNPANNSPATSDVREMRGLSLLINDNYRDSVTGVSCDRVDSIVQDMAGLTVENDTSVIIQRFVDILATLEQRQFLMGGAEAWDGFVVMHFNLFRKLVNNWPDTYYSYRTAANTSTIANLDSVRLQEMRTQMLTGNYLISDRGNIPVITDPAVIEGVGTVGTTTSDIWFVNRTFMGQPTSYVEYLPFNMSQTAQGAIRALAGQYKYRVTDNGRFLVWNNTENTCIRASMVYRPRLRIDTPFLCATMQNVEYSPDLLIQETPFPSDSGYLNGGVTGPYAGAEGTTATISACADVAAGELDFTLDNQFDWKLDNTVYVTIGDVQIPAKTTAIDNSAPFAPVVTVDFTDAAVTPAFYATLTCADLSFVGGQLITPFQEQ